MRSPDRPVSWMPDRFDVVFTVAVGGAFLLMRSLVGSTTVTVVDWSRAVSAASLLAVALPLLVLYAQRRLTGRRRPSDWRGWLLSQLPLVVAAIFFDAVLVEPESYETVAGSVLAATAVLGAVLFAGLGIEALRSWRWRAEAEAARAALAGRLRALEESSASLELRAFKADLQASAVVAGLRTLGERLRAPTGVVDDVEGLLSQLGDHLRAVVASGGRSDGMLADEVQALDPLLELERRARRGAFSWTVEIAESEEDRPVPHLVVTSMLATLLDTRIARGVPARLTITVEGESSDRPALIRLMLVDGQAGIEGAEPRGARALRERLRAVFGNDAGLTFGAVPDGVVVTLVLPREDIMEPRSASERMSVTAVPQEAVAPRRWGRTLANWRPYALVLLMSLVGNQAVAQYLRLESAHRPYSALHMIVRFPLMFVEIALIFWMVRRTPLVSLDGVTPGAPRQFWRRMAVLVGIAPLVVVAVEVLGHWGVGLPMVDPAAQVAETPLLTLKHAIVRYSLVYPVFFIAVAHALEAIAARTTRWWQDRGFGRRVDATAAATAQGELAVLRAELNPHFLGNALHVVGSLVRTDPSRAADLLALLERAVVRAVQPERALVTRLADDVADLRLYTGVAEARYPDLRIITEVADDVSDAAIPPLCLQPAVENAVKHGLRPRSGAGTIWVRAARQGRRLHVIVADDGVGLSATASNTPGIGMAHTRERLAGVFGPTATCVMRPRAAGGTEVVFDLPYRRLRRPA